MCDVACCVLVMYEPNVSEESDTLKRQSAPAGIRFDTHVTDIVQEEKKKKSKGKKRDSSETVTVKDTKKVKVRFLSFI